MAVGHVDPADWLLDRWRLQALPRLTTVDDLAWQPRQRRTLQHVARTGDDGYSCPRWYFPRALLRLRLRRLFLLQSVLFLHSGDFNFSYHSLHLRFLSLLSFYRPLQLFMGLLDRSQQCQGQPDVRCHSRHGYGSPDIRLGSNCIQRLTASHPMLGCCQRWHHYRVLLLVPRPYSLR